MLGNVLLIILLLFVTLNLSKDNIFFPYILEDNTYVEKRSTNFNYENQFKYYINNETVSKFVQDTFNDLETYTCIKFKKENTIFSKNGGFIFNGKTGDMEDTNIKNNPIDFKVPYNCMNHEGCYRRQIFHFLSSRYSRKISNYSSLKEKHQLKSINSRFDFGSILFIKCDLQINDPLEQYYHKMCGFKNEFSFNDYKLLNSLYCQNECTYTCIPCQNGGYQNPKFCDSCICPPGYKGKYCEDINVSDTGCPKYNPLATKKKQTISVCGKQDCIFLLQAPRGYKIITEIEYTTSKYVIPCRIGDNINFKYHDDKGKSGISFCGFYENITLPGYSNELLVSYKGTKNAIALSFSYYTVFDDTEC
ncbi:Metallopeptidase, catalytic domain-containing protein [Strongyloides ratti]|uniref:Metallopeptidase, catalytic domain-containing protein n=1 Tax=Strongyloides ratti TaxID=34506 RepID=A0A090LQR9_STRRB|nr:Metallopeptidase, catalytic domain-containing protein [Strongyloides ratti]CEF69931.1 Metallopeptidase, catalytic domain-containing protein [Strongyloides ratti]